MTSMHTLIAAVPLTLAVLSGCVTEDGSHRHASGGVWEATFYAADGGASQTLGPFTSHDECTQASVKHLGADDRHAQPMAFGCAMTMK